MMVRAVLITGGNMGDTVAYLKAAAELIGERAGRIVMASSVRKSAPWGAFTRQEEENLDETCGSSDEAYSSDPYCYSSEAESTEAERSGHAGHYPGKGRGGAGYFLNQVLVVETELAPLGLLDTLQLIEKELGRKRDGESHEDRRRYYRSRTVDIDILLYNDIIMESPRLVIPHPLMHEREFVLEPLCEIMPEAVHPVSGKPFWLLLKELRESKADEGPLPFMSVEVSQYAAQNESPSQNDSGTVRIIVMRGDVEKNEIKIICEILTKT